MNIHFGGMAPKLSKQLPGLNKQFDRDADAIVRLHVRGILTDSETDKARRRLLKKIETDQTQD